ncbi:Prickle-like protein 2 [Gaertneriomyces sp. JEL0708]|nr:Prickle-like protein 2 [Gaertneriomyces sp. JEL0708]
MGFCPKCGEIIRDTSGHCQACGISAVDSATSGLSAVENQGDKYSNAYLSRGFGGGVESGLKNMLGMGGQVNEVCVECHRKLSSSADVYVGPTHAGGHVYCQGCYSQHFKKGDCESCQKPVLGLGKPYVTEASRIWHQECYAGKSCQECSKVIIGEAIEALNACFHPQCFVCFNCKSRLSNSFLNFNGQPCCRPCHEKINAARPGSNAPSEQLSARTMEHKSATSPLDEFHQRKEISDLHRRCDNCTEVVDCGGIQLPNGWLLHESCFKCAKCGKSISGRYLLDGGQLFHQECRSGGLFTTATSLSCGKCKKPITGQFVKADDVYHSACFVCVSCSTSLAGQPFADTPTGPQCETCLNRAIPTFKPGFTVRQDGTKEMRGPGGAKLSENTTLASLGGTQTCPACRKAVYMSDQVFGPQNTKWHRACLRCTTCKSSLDSMAKMKDVAPYCWKCFTSVK